MKPISLCSFFLMLRPWRRSKKYQFHSLWLDLIGVQTHDSTALEAITLTITPLMRYYKLDISLKEPSQLSFVSMAPVKNLCWYSKNRPSS
jgi:hypothetical protein